MLENSSIVNKNNLYFHDFQLPKLNICSTFHSSNCLEVLDDYTMKVPMKVQFFKLATVYRCFGSCPQKDKISIIFQIAETIYSTMRTKEQPNC